MERLIRLLQKYATGRVVLVLFILTTGIYLTMLLYSIPAVASFAPDMALFDLSPGGYTFDYAVELLETLGSEGRATYLTLQLPLDFIYPGLFAATYSLLLIWLFRRGSKARSKVHYFAVIPVFAGLFDYIENIFIIILLNSFPDISLGIVGLASVFTILKSSFTIISFVLFFWALIRFIKEKRRVV